MQHEFNPFQTKPLLKIPNIVLPGFAMVGKWLYKRRLKTWNSMGSAKIWCIQCSLITSYQNIALLITKISCQIVIETKVWLYVYSYK